MEEDLASANECFRDKREQEYVNDLPIETNVRIEILEESSTIYLEKEKLEESKEQLLLTKEFVEDEEREDSQC